MIKVTVECDVSEGTSRNNDGVTVAEVIECFEQALYGCGFRISGHVDILEDEDIGRKDE